MAKHGPSEVVVTIEDAPGGTVRTMTPYITTIGNISVESITEQTNPFGVASEQHTPVGLAKTSDIPLGGFFDDAANAVHAVFNITSQDRDPSSVGRELIITVASGRTFTVTVHLVKYDVIAKRDGLTEYQAIVRQASAGVWA